MLVLHERRCGGVQVEVSFRASAVLDYGKVVDASTLHACLSPKRKTTFLASQTFSAWRGRRLAKCFTKHKFYFGSRKNPLMRVALHLELTPEPIFVSPVSSYTIVPCCRREAFPDTGRVHPATKPRNWKRIGGRPQVVLAGATGQSVAE